MKRGLSQINNALRLFLRTQGNTALVRHHVYLSIDTLGNICLMSLIIIKLGKRRVGSDTEDTQANKVRVQVTRMLLVNSVVFFLFHVPVSWIMLSRTLKSSSESIASLFWTHVCMTGSYFLVNIHRASTTFKGNS